MIDQYTMNTIPALYGYRARVRSIYDADTLRLDLDLGCNTWIMNEPIRLYGINAPEVRGEEKEAGQAARDWLRQTLPEGMEVWVRTFKDKKGKYGRWLAVVWYIEPETGGWVNVNRRLVEVGHAVEVDYE